MKNRPKRKKRSGQAAANATEPPNRSAGSPEPDLPAALADLAERLRAVEAACNPSGQNLHFGVEVQANPAALQALYDVGLEAWRAVESRQSWRASLWFYKWFLLIASVTLQIWRDHTAQEYPDALVRRLALLLSEISQMTMMRGYEGDIQKRHYEAMVHTLLAFRQKANFLEFLVTEAQKTRKEQVIGLVQGAMEAAERIERETHK